MAVENVAFDLTSEHAYYCKIQLNATYGLPRSEADDEEILERASRHWRPTFIESVLLPGD